MAATAAARGDERWQSIDLVGFTFSFYLSLSVLHLCTSLARRSE